MSSNFANVTDMTEFFEAADTVSGGMLALGVPIVMWITLFGFGLRSGRAQAITYASFGTGIILLLENIAGLVEYWVIIADILLLTLGIFLLLHERKSFEGL